MNNKPQLSSAAKSPDNADNLIPLQRLARSLLSLSISGDLGKMLDLDLNNSLTVSSAAENPRLGRRTIRVVPRSNCINILFGMDELIKVNLDEIDYVELGKTLVAYLKNGKTPSKA